MNDNEILNNEQIENKKSNTFNLIIGIATLMIAILGATFAYFTMSSGSAENAITVKSAFVSISYDGGTKVAADDLIPTNERVMQWAYRERLDETYTDPEDGTEKTFQCLDSNNRKVCYVYQFTVRSDGEQETTNILGTITVNQNEFIEETKNEDGEVIETKSGLSYMVYELTEDAEENITYTKVSAGLISSANQSDIDEYGSDNEEYKFVRFGIPTQTIQDDGATVTTSVDNFLFGTDGHIEITNGVDHVYQLVVWLHDDNEDQNKEQAKNFAGTIKVNVNSADNVGGIITGTKGDEEQPEDEPTTPPVVEEPTTPGTE